MKKSSETTDRHAARRLRRQPLGRYRYMRLRWRVLFAVVDLVGTLVFGAARTIRRLAVKALIGDTPAPSDRQSDPQVILLVQLDHLGDAVISTVMLPALRQRYPQASIEVLASASNREVFEALPEVDRVYVSRANRFARGARFRLAWIAATLWWGLALRRRRVDLGIDVRGEFPSALILWLSRARRRLGWNCGGGGFLLTDSPCFVPGRPEVASRLALLAELGIRPSEPCDLWRPRFRPGEQARRHVGRQLAELQQSTPSIGPRIVLHVAAGTPAKQWPVEHWRELIGRLIVCHAAQVVLVGSSEDRAIARQVLEDRSWPGVADWTGCLRISELAALLEQADVLVGPDSGPAHLAAAVGAAVVVLFSGTNNPRQWQPCGDAVTVVRQRVECSPCHRQCCPRAGHPCMSRLRPEMVSAAVEQVLDSAPGKMDLPRQGVRMTCVAEESEDDCAEPRN